VLALLIGVIVLFGLAGCAGADSDEGDARRPAGASTATQRAGDEFVRRLDAVCQDTNPRLAQIQADLTKVRDAGRAGQVSLPKTFEGFATLLRQASATARRLVVRLRAIAVPAHERAFRDALIASVSGGAANLRQQLRAAEAQDAGKLRELSVQGSVLNARAKVLVAGHGGFRFCGRGG
jgi:hypothetical protein